MRGLPGTAPRVSKRHHVLELPAASFARKYELAAKHQVNLEGALTWPFEFEDQAYFAGFRQLNSNGLDLPVMNVFRMFSRLQGQRIAAESSAQIPLNLRRLAPHGIAHHADQGTVRATAVRGTTRDAGTSDHHRVAQWPREPRVHVATAGCVAPGPRVDVSAKLAPRLPAHHEFPESDR